MSTRLHLTSSAQSAHFHAVSGATYTTLSLLMDVGGEKVAGPQKLMIRTSDLPEFYLLVGLANDAWERAKDVEKRENAT